MSRVARLLSLTAVLLCGCGGNPVPAAAPRPSREPPLAQPPRAKLDPDSCPAGLSADPSERTEIAMGCVIDLLLRSAFRRDPDARAAAYVQAIGERVARCSDRSELPWRFVLTASSDVEAHALPGGLVLVSRATLDAVGSEAELGAILAHEIAHISFAHSQAAWDPKVPPAGNDAVDALRDADEERQADELGTVYLARAGYHPRAMFDALHALERAEASGSSEGCSGCQGEDPHPAWPARLARVAVAAGSEGGERGRERYQRMRAGAEVRVPEVSCK